MMTRRCIGFLAACVLLLAPAAGAVAAEGIQLGPTLLYPALDVKAAYDDNFFLASANPDSGWEMKFSPSLRLKLPVNRFYLEASGGLDFITYLDIEEDNQEDWFVGGAVGADFPGGLGFKVADTLTQRYLTATQEFGAGEDYSENVLAATVGYAVRSALRLELSGNRTAVAYEVSLDRERVETTLQADLYWKFRPALSAILEGSYADFAYDSNTAQDSSETEVTFGLSWDVTARSRGFAKAGYEWKRYDAQDPSLGTEDAGYYTLSGGLRYFITPRSVIVLDLSRASQESDFQENPYFLQTKVAANFAQRMTPKTFFRLSASYTNDDYPNATSYDNPYDPRSGLQSGTRTDTTLIAGVSLGFDMTRWLALELGYEGEWRNSTFDTFDYNANRVTLSAKAAF